MMLHVLCPIFNMQSHYLPMKLLVRIVPAQYFCILFRQDNLIKRKVEKRLKGKPLMA